MRKNQLEAVALIGMIEGKRARGRQRKTFMDWISAACGDKWNITKFWKFVKTVMSICWSPTLESGVALTSDRIVRGPRALKSNSFDFRDVNVLKSEIYFFSFRSVKQRQHNNDASVKFSLRSCCEILSLRCVHNTMTAVVSSLRFRCVLNPFLCWILDLCEKVCTQDHRIKSPNFYVTNCNFFTLLADIICRIVLHRPLAIFGYTQDGNHAGLST